MKANIQSNGLLWKAVGRANELNIATEKVGDADIFDFGIHAKGGLEAGICLARVTSGDLARIEITQTSINGHAYPAIQFRTDSPLWACMGSQYAGWPVQCDNFFAMASGPIRMLRGKEKILEEFSLTEEDSYGYGCICLETSKMPSPEVVESIANEAGIETKKLHIAVAPTSSIAGSVQVVARSVETAMHKLHELEFDISKVLSGVGVAPIPPIANDDLKGIGLTNDSILFGGKVDLWVDVDQEIVDKTGPLLPSSSSEDYGTPFYELFKQKDFDFYKIDPHLFSPACVTIHNLASGESKTFGKLDHGLLSNSFGI